MIALRIVQGVTAHFMVRSIEWFNSIVLMNFGITLLRTGETFSTSHAYDTLASIAKEDTWGWALVCIAGIRVLSLIFNGTFSWFQPLSPWARVITAYLSSLAWLFIAIGLFWSNTMAPGPGTYLVHAMFDIFIASVIARDASRVPTRKRYANA